MTDGDQLGINAALRKASGFAPEEGAEPSAELVLAACLLRLARETGLAEREDPDFGCVEHAGIPQAAMRVLNYYVVGDPATHLTDEMVRDSLYCALLDLARDPSALQAIDKSRSMTGDELLMFGQIYWNLEADGTRTKLPIKSRQKLSSGQLARIKTPREDRDFATLVLKNRAVRTPGYTQGGGFYARGARIAVLAARLLAFGKEAHPVGGARACLTETGRGEEWSLVWPTAQTSVASPGLGALTSGESVTATQRPSLTAPPGDRCAAAPAHLSLESAVAVAADRFDMPPGLRLWTASTGTVAPARFLSGASLNGAEVGRYAVARRVDVDGDELTVDEVAAHISVEESVGYLIAGAGEGKSTYLHALCSSLMSRAIVFRWRVTDQPDWSKLEDFRDLVASPNETGKSHEPPIVVVGELATKPTRKQEDALIEIIQGIPSGLAPPRTSMVLAGRPAWLNRIRQRVSTGQTLRLMPLSGAEAELLIENLADAHLASCRDKGAAWTKAHFPNLESFLALPRTSQVAVFFQGTSLVGSLIHAAYGREFRRRLIAEYGDLETAERSAYLLVSLATSALGGISAELLEGICPDANIERCSSGSPWQRDVDGRHSARHEMIGKLVVEDKDASTPQDISRIIGEIVDSAVASAEARELFLNSVRIFDESQSLVPKQQRKTELEFRAALRSGILENRESWERLEPPIGSGTSELLAYSYALHRVLPEKLVRGEGNEYLVARSQHLLALAESAAAPGSPLASRARYYRIILERDARHIRGDVIDDPSDIKALLPMMSHTWPESDFYAQVLSLGVSTLRNCDLGEVDSDKVAGAVLEAWQRLRFEGVSTGQTYLYSSFVARDLYNLPSHRRLSLMETAWEFSRALANPDGSLACMLDDELQKSGTGQNAATSRARRRHILSESVVPGQENAEVVLRFAHLAASEDESVLGLVERVSSELMSADNPTTRSMALHAMAIVARSDEDRLDYLSAALPAYEQSMTSRDDWLTRGLFWKRALRLLRGIAPDEASLLEGRIAAAGQKFRR